MQKKIKQAQKYLEWQKPNQAIAELRGVLKSSAMPEEHRWVPNHMMGIALSLKGKHEPSARYLEKAVKQGSDQPETCHMLSVNYFKLGQLEKAEQYGNEAVERRGDFLKAWLNLGAVYRAQAKLDEALKCYKKANQLDPANAGVAFHIGEIYRDQGDLEQAMKLFDITLKIDGDDIRSMLEKADIFKKRGNLDEALESLEQAREVHGDQPSIAVGEAEIYKARGKYDDAIALYESLLEKHPDSGPLRVNYALCLQETSHFDQSEKHYRQAIDDMEDSRNPISNYLMGLHYNPRNSRDYIFNEHVRLGEAFIPRDGQKSVIPSDTAKDKRLKVGFVSGGFRRHPVGWMIAGALEQLPNEKFELFGYTMNNQFDFITRRIHKNIDHWRSVVAYSSDVVENIILKDELDILVDLSGHAADNCLEVMARKPALIIVKWVGGLFNTTGLEAFDYLISDWHETPEGADAYYTEKLVRLPDDYIVYVPPGYAPEVDVQPAEKNSHITFGCFNNPTKVNEKLLKRWSEIMRQVPDSRLYLKSKQYDTASFRTQIIDVMEGEGIAGDRIEFTGQTSHDDHLAAYNRVDIALDPWPYSGGLTTCEALYMGVPVITMPGPTFAGRHSTTHLINAGLNEFVTDSWEGYIQQAVNLAGDRPRLKGLREHLRSQLLQSPLCNGKRFGAHLSVAFREMWKQRVAGYENDIAEWQHPITVDPLSEAQIAELTDGPDKTPLITVQDTDKEPEKGLLPHTDGEILKNEMLEKKAVTETMNETEELVKNMEVRKREGSSNGAVSAEYSVNGHPKNNGHGKSRGKENDAFHIETKDGVTICTPADLDLLTPYVLLEQEQWFEPELDFVRDYLKPGMQAVDTGAGFGVYCFPMAKRVGAEGNVYAFEPDREMKRHLEMSKLENGLSRVEIIGRGLADKAGSARFTKASSPELNSVSDDGEEEITLTTLDAWWDFAGQPTLDLLKIDVNGMEPGVLRGAAGILKETAPVILVSIGETSNSLAALRDQFQELDYRLFEYIPGPGLLAQHDPEAGVDPYVMNVIAIRENRIEEFKEAGWIYDESISCESADDHRWKEVLCKQPWAVDKITEWEKMAASGDHDAYLSALNLVCAAEQIDISPDDPASRSRKGATLLAAAEKLTGLFNAGKAGIAAAMTYVRVMNQLGKREQALEMMKELMETTNAGDSLDAPLPFLSPLPQQDHTDVQTDFSKWLTVRIVEGWILLKDFTTYMSGDQERRMLEALEGNPEVSIETEKRIQLTAEDRSTLSCQVKLNNWFWKALRKKERGISIVGQNNNLKGTPSQVVRAKMQYDYINHGNPLYVNIPKRELFRLKNIFVDHEYSLPKGFHINNNGVIVDIGSNIGTFALYARQWNSNAIIHCFEPNPQVIPLFNSNTRHMKNITRNYIALGEKDGEVNLSQHPINTGQSTTSHEIAGAHSVEVKIKNSGMALAGKQVSSIDVLKIDTEGAEISILRGMPGLLNNTKVIMLEYHSEKDRREIDAMLDQFQLYSTDVQGISGIGTVKYVNNELLT